MDGAVREGQGNKAIFCTAVFECNCIVQCHHDRKWLNVDGIHKKLEVVGEAYIGAPIDEGEELLDADGQ